MRYLKNFSLENINFLELTNKERLIQWEPYISSTLYVNFHNVYFSKQILMTDWIKNSLVTINFKNISVPNQDTMERFLEGFSNITL